MKTIALLALSAFCLGNLNSLAADDPKANPYKQTLAAVPAAELPAKAADLVSAAKRTEREVTTISVVRAAVQLNPAAAPAIVGAVSHAVTEMAPFAARAAVAEQPKLAVSITRAAAAATPKKVGKVVAAVCRAVPSDYRSVAVAAAEAVPGSGKEILDAVTSVLPELQPSFDAAVASYNGLVPSVADVIDSAKVSAPSTSSDNGGPTAFPRGPAIGPPYLPFSGAPANVTPATGGQVPTGGRNYAAP